MYIHTKSISLEALAAVQGVPGTVCLMQHLLHNVQYFPFLYHVFFFCTALQLIASTCVCDRYKTCFSQKNHNV